MTSAAPERIGRTSAQCVGRSRSSRRATVESIGRELKLVIHQGTHARRGMKVGSTLRAAPNQDRLFAGVRARRAGGLQFRARVVTPWAPLPTDDARQLGRDCVCACPCQGAQCGCRLRSGAALQFLRPAHLPPAGAIRALPTHPARGSSGDADPNGVATPIVNARVVLLPLVITIARATSGGRLRAGRRLLSSTGPGPAHSRSALVSGGLSSCRRIFSAVQGGGPLRHLARRTLSLAAMVRATSPSCLHVSCLLGFVMPDRLEALMFERPKKSYQRPEESSRAQGQRATVDFSRAYKPSEDS